MIQVIHYQNESTEKPFEAYISECYDEVRKLLSKLPKTIKIYFSDYGIIPESGVGGFAYADDIITLSLDPDFADKQAQQRDIRPTIFHEAFHIYQNYTGTGKQYSAIEGALYEGMATIFEREYAGVFQPYGDYRKTSEADLKKWTETLRKFGSEYLEDDKIYRAWKFYHPELKERWIAYRVGAWMTDQVLEKHRLTILDLSTKTAAEVLILFDRQDSNG